MSGIRTSVSSRSNSLPAANAIASAQSAATVVAIAGGREHAIDVQPDAISSSTISTLAVRRADVGNLVLHDRTS
jgi:hypothetical protein